MKRDPSAPSGRRARNKEEKRERLRQAAWELFREVGFDAATTRAIAERADVAAGTVFVYAKDKSDLLFLVFEERLRKVSEDALAKAPRRRALPARLTYVFERIFEMYSENRDLSLRFLRELPGAEGPNAMSVHAVTFRFFGDVARLIEEEKAKGHVRQDVDSYAAAEAIFGLYFMALLMSITQFTSPEPSFSVRIRRSLDFLFEGLKIP